MSEAEARSAYDARCAAVADYMSAQGASLSKSPAQHELEVSNGSRRVVFPVVTDDADWQETTAEEAFYAVMIDAKSWRGVHLEDSLKVAPDQEEPIEAPRLRQESNEQATRMEGLAAVLGGEDRVTELFGLVEAP